MTMSAGDMRTWIRLQLEVDSADLPDTLVNTYLRSATTKVHSHFDQWSFFEETWTFTSVADQADYTESDYTGTTLATATFEEVQSVKRADQRLAYVSQGQLDRMDIDRSSSGDSTHWTKWGSTITIYPTPSVAETYTIRGYREGTDWIGLNESADVPLDLEESVLFWALGMAYAQQDDPESAVHWYDMSEHILQRAQSKYRSTYPSDDMVMNARTISSGPFDRLRFPFE